MHKIFMERILGFFLLSAILLIILSAFSRDNRGPGLIVGAISGLAGGGALAKILSSNSSNKSSRIEESESEISASKQSISQMSHRLQNGAVEASSQTSEPDKLLSQVKNMEKPVNSFKMMVESSEHDLEEIISNAKKFLKLKHEEKEKMDEIKEALGPSRGIRYQLSQLEGMEDMVVGTEEDKIQSVIQLAEKIDTKIEEIESKQEKYEKLLSQQEHSLLRDINRNQRALEDIQACIEAISQAENMQQQLSRIVSESQRHYESLQLTEAEIQKIEYSLNQILNMEKSVVQELEELRQIEQQNERITEEEIQEVKELLQEDHSIEKMLENTSEKFKKAKNSDEHQEIFTIMERLKQVLEKLGAEFEQEEKEENTIKEEVSKAEDNISEQVEVESEEVAELEHETQKEKQKNRVNQTAAHDRSFSNTSPQYTYDFLEQINPQKWKGLVEPMIRCQNTGQDNQKAYFDSSDGVYKLVNSGNYNQVLYAPDSSKTSRSIMWGDASWLYIVNGNLKDEDKIHYVSSNPKHVAIMAEEADKYLMSQNIDYHFKVDINKKYHYRDIETHILIIYVNDGENIADQLESIRNDLGIRPSDSYKEQYEDGEEYKRYKGFVINYYELR